MSLKQRTLPGWSKVSGCPGSARAHHPPGPAPARSRRLPSGGAAAPPWLRRPDPPPSRAVFLAADPVPPLGYLRRSHRPAGRPRRQTHRPEPGRPRQVRGAAAGQVRPDHGGGASHGTARRGRGAAERAQPGAGQPRTPSRRRWRGAGGLVLVRRCRASAGVEGRRCRRRERPQRSFLQQRRSTSEGYCVHVAVSADLLSFTEV